MKKYFVLVLFCIAGNTLFAQMGMGKPEDIKTVANRTMFVVLKSEEKETLEELKNKPDELKAYQQAIEEYNDGAREAFTKNWKFSKEIKYVYKASFDSLKQASKKGTGTPFAYFAPEMHNLRGGTKFGKAARQYSLMIGLSEKLMPVFTTVIRDPNPTEGDITYTIQLALDYFDLRLKDKSRKDIVAEIDARTPAIKNKILIINKDMANEKLKKDIATIYKYEYELCSKDAIEKAIINHDARYAFVRSLPMQGAFNPGDVTYEQYIVNAEDGSTMYGLGGDIKGEVSKSHIEKLAKVLSK
nr:hypothetical protein [uncultured Flavobacterium sp.]